MNPDLSTEIPEGTKISLTTLLNMSASMLAQNGQQAMVIIIDKDTREVWADVFEDKFDVVPWINQRLGH